MVDFDTVVIGGGFSGLSAAVRLAQFGYRVCLVERQPRLGGMNTYFEKAGRTVETALHALTNWPGANGSGSPWPLIWRQLRIPPSQLVLSPQRFALVRWGKFTLSFDNQCSLLAENVRQFSGGERWEEFVSRGVLSYSQWNSPAGRSSTQEALARWFGDSPLVQLLYLPVAAFGAATERDMPFGVFSMLFRSIFLEGLCRPAGGIKTLLTILEQKFRQHGGVILLENAVKNIRTEGNRVVAVSLGNGESLQARHFVSTIGWPETWALLEKGTNTTALGTSPPAGRISFLETIVELSRPPGELGFEASMLFYAAREGLEFRSPDGLMEPELGAVCAPGNFHYPEVPSADLARTIRLTCLASFERWASLSPDRYQDEKIQAAESLLETLARLGWDFRPYVVNMEVTTPLTLARYTGRRQGAVYGSPQKLWSGQTPFANLFLAGTDQGMPGVVGALLSGIMVVNKYVLAGQQA